MDALDAVQDACEERGDDPYRDELIHTAAVLLTGQPGILGGMVKGVGTDTVVRVTNLTRNYTTAAVMLARHLIGEVDRMLEVERRVREEKPEPFQLGEQDDAS